MRGWLQTFWDDLWIQQEGVYTLREQAAKFCARALVVILLIIIGCFIYYSH